MSVEAQSYDFEDLGLLSGPPDPVLQTIARLASDLLSAPFAKVSLEDIVHEKIRIRAIHGFDQAIVDELEPTLDLPVCRTIIRGRRIVALDDLRGPDNTVGNSFLEALGARSYLGAPVFDPANTAVGTLCVLGTTARIWSERQQVQIADLASLVTERITLRATLATVKLLSKQV